MPRLRTDDGPRKLRAVWLGPKGATLPFEWTYVQWVVSLAMLPVGITAVTLILAGASHTLSGSYAWWFAVPISILLGGYLALLAAVRIMRNVTFDEPVRYKIAVLRDEFGRHTRSRRSKPVEWRLATPRIID